MRNKIIGFGSCAAKVVERYEEYAPFFLPTTSHYIESVLTDDRHISPSEFLSLSVPFLFLRTYSSRSSSEDCNTGAVRPRSHSPGLTLSPPEGMEYAARTLLDMRICSRVRRLNCTWWWEDDPQWVAALIGGCSETLEYVYIEDDSTFGKWSLSASATGTNAHVMEPEYLKESSTDLSKRRNSEKWYSTLVSSLLDGSL